MDIEATVYGAFTAHETFEVGRDESLPLAGDGFYHQWRMYEPGEAIIRREFSFNLPEEVLMSINTAVMWIRIKKPMARN